MFLNFRNPILPSLLCVVLLTACTDKKAHSQSRKAQKEIAREEAVTAGLTVTRRWTMPAALTEISGIAFYQNRLACIQDEDGIIFLFNPATGTVEKEIPFGDKGDYEGIAVVGETAWVLRSDGQLFEVQAFASGTPVTKSFATPLTQKQDTEGLFYDAAHNRLLISVKGKDPESDEAKSVFAFPLSTRQMAPAPVYQLTVAAESASGKKGKKKGSKLQPSELALHPTTGELYVLDGPKSILYIMDASGTEKQAYALDKKDAPQPEGLAFAPDGTLYISTEGGKGSGAILQVRL